MFWSKFLKFLTLLTLLKNSISIQKFVTKSKFEERTVSDYRNVYDINFEKQVKNLCFTFFWLVQIGFMLRT